MTTHNVDDLLQKIEFAERALSEDDVEAAWRAFLAAHPEHPRALFYRGRGKIEKGEIGEGMALLQRAESLDKTYAEIPFYLALGLKLQGDLGAALGALDRALAIDPYFFMALLSKGAIQESAGRARLAAKTYKNALKAAPDPTLLGPSQRAAYEHAKRRVTEYDQSLAQHLRAATQDLRAIAQTSARFEESIDIVAGLKPRQVHDPLLYYFPQLPAIPFYDRAHFPWLSQLEAATDTIRAELEVVLREDAQKFAPYIQLPAGAPVNQWVNLNHSKLWSTLHLWRDGTKQEANCVRCPKTVALLESLPMARQENFAPSVVFSVLQPKTHIPPHTGSTNVRLLCHLPLILPPDCRFRVGNETRPWRMGEAWVFDDSIDHEAWNDSDQVRVILIFDVLNPLISEAEHALVTRMLNALHDFDAA